MLNLDEIKNDIKQLTFRNQCNIPGVIYRDIMVKQQEILLILAKLVKELENAKS